VDVAVHARSRFPQIPVIMTSGNADNIQDRPEQFAPLPFCWTSLTGWTAWPLRRNLSLEAIENAVAAGQHGAGEETRRSRPSFAPKRPDLLTVMRRHRPLPVRKWAFSDGMEIVAAAARGRAVVRVAWLSRRSNTAANAAHIAGRRGGSRKPAPHPA
jgi:hypothetical protein